MEDTTAATADELPDLYLQYCYSDPEIRKAIQEWRKRQ